MEQEGLSTSVCRETAARLLQQATMAEAEVDRYLRKQLARRDWSLLCTNIFLASALLVFYFLGVLGFSFGISLALVIFLLFGWNSYVRGVVERVCEAACAWRARRKAVSSDETVEWLNIFVQHWWMECAPGIVKKLKSKLDPKLERAAAKGMLSELFFCCLN